jgi:hypothetical protein
VFFDEEADLQAYIDSHVGKGSFLYLYQFSTTKEEERLIAAQAGIQLDGHLPSIMGGFCANAVSNALIGIKRFESISSTFSPIRLAHMLDNIGFRFVLNNRFHWVPGGPARKK